MRRRPLTLTTAWINLGDIGPLKLRINMDRRTNSTGKRKRVEFSIWQHQWAAHPPAQSNRKMQSAPSKRNSWIQAKPFSWLRSIRHVKHAVPLVVSLCPTKNRCEHNRWQLCKRPDHWRQLSTANRHCRVSREPPSASKCYRKCKIKWNNIDRMNV